MSQVEQTAEEVMDSLTGHDEMAISQHFGKTVSWLVEHDELMLGRALVFVTKRREDGVNDDDARNAAFDLPMKSLIGYFASEETDASGKDELEPEPQPASSLSSVS